MINILWRNMPQKVFDLMCEKQKEMKKKKQRCVSQGEALAALVMENNSMDEKPGPPKATKE